MDRPFALVEEDFIGRGSRLPRENFDLRNFNIESILFAGGNGITWVINFNADWYTNTTVVRLALPSLKLKQ